MQAEDEGEWVFTGVDGEERGPYSLSQLRKLLGRCAPWRSSLSKLEAGLGWAVQGLQAQVHTTIHAGLHCTPCKPSHPAAVGAGASCGLLTCCTTRRQASPCRCAAAWLRV